MEKIRVWKWSQDIWIGVLYVLLCFILPCSDWSLVYDSFRREYICSILCSVNIYSLPSPPTYLPLPISPPQSPPSFLNIWNIYFQTIYLILQYSRNILDTSAHCIIALHLCTLCLYPFMFFVFVSIYVHCACIHQCKFCMYCILLCTSCMYPFIYMCNVHCACFHICTFYLY